MPERKTLTVTAPKELTVCLGNQSPCHQFLTSLPVGGRSRVYEPRSRPQFSPRHSTPRCLRSTPNRPAWHSNPARARPSCPASPRHPASLRFHPFPTHPGVLFSLLPSGKKYFSSFHKELLPPFQNSSNVSSSWKPQRSRLPPPDPRACRHLRRLPRPALSPGPSLAQASGCPAVEGVAPCDFPGTQLVDPRAGRHSFHNSDFLGNLKLMSGLCL